MSDYRDPEIESDARDDELSPYVDSDGDAWEIPGGYVDVESPEQAPPRNLGRDWLDRDA